MVLWPRLKVFLKKPRHSQSQGSERMIKLELREYYVNDMDVMSKKQTLELRT